MKKWTTEEIVKLHNDWHDGGRWSKIPHDKFHNQLWVALEDVEEMERRIDAEHENAEYERKTALDREEK